MKMLPKIKDNYKKQNKQNIVEIYPSNSFVLQFDGCSRSNPGLAGAGAVIYHDNEEILANHFFVGTNATNNHAEYAGLILGLEHAIQMNIKNLIVEGDSLLVINQMTGTYKCNSINLIELYDKAKELSKEFETITFNHIYRNKNKRADQLSNMAVDEYLQANEIE